MNFIRNRNFRAGPQTSLEDVICPQNSDKQQKNRVFRRSGEGVKNTENPGCNPERCTFRFVKYLSIVFGIVNFLPVCASTV